MLCFRSLFFVSSPIFLLFSSTCFSFTYGDSHFLTFQTTPTSGGEGEYGLRLVIKRLLAEGSNGNGNGTAVNSSLLLAEDRTRRRDPLNDFEKYTGGWNISNKHYWASVGFTAAPLFVIAALWFVLFSACLIIICLRHCCCPKEPIGYSRMAYALSLILLILFTVAAVVGCIVLYTGQGKFHSSSSNTLEYVVGQANITVENLRNVSEYLAAAKQIGVEQVFLPSNVLTDIDQIQTKINSSANTLSTRASENAEDIHDILNSVRVALIVISAAMLLLTFLGFVFSIFGLQFLVYLLVIIGWIFVTGTFILCGIFLLLHNVTADTCVAMNEWVQNPTAHTALDDILPCVDNATAQETSIRSKEVTSQLVNVINQVITNVSNINFSPNFRPLYYNQSGPLMPVLCNPFNPDLSDRVCSSGEVDLSNATQVWGSYVCQVSTSGNCTTTGRVTPQIYNQMAAAVNVSYGLYHYGPFLVDLQDCTFVRHTFNDISTGYCPGLRRYSGWIYVGLVMVSAAVMLSLLFWVVYGRERKHRVYTKSHMAGPAARYEPHKHT